jgi:hypothetical protein
MIQKKRNLRCAEQHEVSVSRQLGPRSSENFACIVRRSVYGEDRRHVRDVHGLRTYRIPESEHFIRSPYPCKYVLELNAGMIGCCGIRVGQRVMTAPFLERRKIKARLNPYGKWAS